MTMDLDVKISNCDVHNLLYDVSVTSTVCIVTLKLLGKNHTITNYYVVVYTETQFTCKLFLFCFLPNSELAT